MTTGTQNVLLAIALALSLTTASCAGKSADAADPAAPNIITQPMDETVKPGQSAVFSVVASGTAPLSYQWEKNSAAIGGATAASYTTPATTSADSGATFAVVVSNTAGSMTSTSATLTVSAAPAPVITSATTASGTVGTAFSYQITAANSPTSFGATGLPAGLLVNTSSGLISGTPTAAGTSTVTLGATNTGGTGNATLTLTVNAAAAPVITSATTVSGTVGTAFSYQIIATNSPTSFGATGLPAGLSVNTGTGLISGTPTAAGTSTVTLGATNTGGTGHATLTLTVNAAASPVITSATTASGTVGAAFSYQITATNSPASFGATGLPAGLSVNTGTGLISGAPTATGTSTINLSATNTSGTGHATLTLTVSQSGQGPAITSATTASGTVGMPFSYQITATNSPTSFGATGLPSGLSVNTGTGLISGTPTATGTSTINLSATNNSGAGNATLTLTVSGGVAQGQLMTLSANGKYLVNSVTGKPVFLIGDDAFDLAVMLNSAQVSTYLNDRASRGFNAIWLAAADNAYQSIPPQNFFGISPFDGADFTNEDPNYWANIDSVVTQASSLGITVFLQPFFVGDGVPGTGYYSSVLNSSDAVMTAYGTFLGNRYQGYNNIVWLLGGDSHPSVPGLFQKLNDVGAAIAAADPNHLITLEACEQCVLNGYNSIQAYQVQALPVPSWLNLNWAYPQLTTTVAAAQNAYTQTPFLAPLCGENFYELTNGLTELNVRFEQYAEILSGCYVGRIFGNGAIWNFNSPNGGFGPTPTWQTELSSPGSVSQQYQGRLFSSREHWLLVPDINHAGVTAGYGSGLTVTTAARTSDGQTIIAYIPNGNATTITVAMNQITSSTNTVQGWWFNPTTAATTNLGTFPNSGTQNFTPPDSNDWVLVLDDASAALSAPGTGTP